MEHLAASYPLVRVLRDNHIVGLGLLVAFRKAAVVAQVVGDTVHKLVGPEFQAVLVVLVFVVEGTSVVVAALRIVVAVPVAPVVVVPVVVAALRTVVVVVPVVVAIEVEVAATFAVGVVDKTVGKVVEAVEAVETVGTIEAVGTAVVTEVVGTVVVGVGLVVDMLAVLRVLGRN